MEDDIRRRSACDRCHSQKLRCPKRQGADICDRCAKAGASCRYSPFRQKKDPEKSQNGDKSLVDFHHPVFNKSAGENKDSRKTSTNLTCYKRKRIAPPSLDPDLEPELGFCSIPTQTAEEQISNAMGSDWCLNSPPAFHDLLNDSAFGDINFESQSEYPPLEFSLPSSPNFKDYGDKMNNLLQFRSPPPTVSHSLDRGQFGRPFSPLPDPGPPPSRLALALPTPQLRLWAGDVRKNQQSVSQCIRQLSDLSLRLYEHGTTIPPQSIHTPVPANESYVDVMNARAQDYTAYKVEDTFQLTQELLDIYPCFIEIFTRRKIPQASHSSHIRTNLDPESLDYQNGECLGPIAPSISNPLALDHSSILLILSCHVRLVEIYDELFQHMKVCIEQKGGVCMSEEGTFTAPQLRIGSYVPPAATAVPMQMMLLVHFATSLCDYAVELESNIREPHWSGSSGLPNGKNGNAMAALSLASAEKVKDRATGMLQYLTSLRTIMVTEGYLA